MYGHTSNIKITGVKYNAFYITQITGYEEKNKNCK